MENPILDSLEDLGYQGSVKDFNKMIKEGPKNCNFTRIVEWLSKELQVLCKLESQVNAISSADDSSSFLLELSSFLKEMNCPYQCLLQGNVSQRLGSKENRLILLSFLTIELQAARVINVDKPEKSLQVEMQETPTAKDMKSMITTLKLGKPPANITPAQLFGKLESRINEIISKMPPNKLSSALFTGKLSDKQWFILSSIQETMKNEYQLRREMLLKRLDVTIQSFKWADRLKCKEKEIMNAYMPLRQLLGTEPSVCLSDVLAAREDLTIIEKTSNMHVREKTQLASVNKVVIGRVPDRGGRPEEQQPPPPEMPSWQKRTDTPKDTNIGRGGGRIQGGGWSGGNPQQQTNSYGQGGNRNDQSGGYTGGGGYQSGGGGYQAGGGRGGGYGGGYVQQGGGYQTGYQPGYVQVDQGGYQTGYMQGGQAVYQVPYQPVQGGYSQTGYQMGQGGYGQGGDSRNARYNDQQSGDNRNRGQQYNPSAPRGGYSSRNEGYHYSSDGGGGGYNQDSKDGWQSRGGRGGRGGGRGGRGGRGGGRYDSQNQGYGANYGYSAYDQGYGQHNQRY